MAKISLRVYNREIEGLIEGGQLDEAIAHCQHILKTFSMHIGTYQLLGKAFLEAHRYADAIDIFQRILNAVPDDFISNVGMSIIRDDEGKLDESIWHMERAFEVQPSNPAIQGELRRLYGQRDGVEPPKIRLSRDALANMYAQGELFSQAIAEIRAVLAEDPERPDLQVMLARAYFKTGQKVEAAEIAAHLLKKYPYCLDALRVLAEVLPGTARAENTQVYRTRLRLLDPYSTFVTDSVFNSDQVPDASVSLDRLEYSPGRQASPSQPAWADSLGIKIDKPKTESPQPAWLSQAAPEPTQEKPEPPPASEPAQAQEGLPDFLKSAGWSETDGDATGVEPAALEAPGEEEIAKAEMPDWLKSQFPAELKEPVEGIPAVENNDLPAWLQDAGTGAVAAAAGATGLAEPEEKLESTPEVGLAGLADQASISAKEESPPIAGEEEDSTSWLEELAAKQDEKGGLEPGRMPQGTDQPPPQQPSPMAPVFSSGQSETAMPAAESEPPAIQSGKQVGIEDDTMAWLEGLAARHGAKQEELLTKPEDLTEKMPDWLKQTADEGAKAVFKEELPPAEIPAAAEIPAVSLPTPGSERIPGVADENLAWLEEAGTDIPAESKDEAWKAEVEPTPDWLKDLAGGKDSKTSEAVQPPAAAPADRHLELDNSTLDSSSTAQDDVTITSWLKNLDESKVPKKAGPFDETMKDVRAVGDDVTPEWLQQLKKQPPATESSAPDKEPASETPSIPDWLGQPHPEQAETSQVPAGVVKDEPPAWIHEEVEPSDQAVPTNPAEWMPVDERPAAPMESEPVSPPAPEAAMPAPPAARPKGGKGTGILSSVPGQDKDSSILATAQQLLDQQKLADSMKEYGKLIKKGRLLDEVIHDIREALYRHPVDIILWQTLGDAYMRMNRLQDALDAYTKAEELIR